MDFRNPPKWRMFIVLFLAFVMMGIGLFGAAFWIGPADIFDPMMAVPGFLVNWILYAFMAHIGISGFWLMRVATREFTMWATIVGLQATVQVLTQRLRTIEGRKGVSRNVIEQ